MCYNGGAKRKTQGKAPADAPTTPTRRAERDTAQRNNGMENAKNIRHVYADNAATTAMSTAALEKMIWALENQYGNPSSLHTVGQEAKVYLEDARARVAKCLGAADPRDASFPSFKIS